MTEANVISGRTMKKGDTEPDLRIQLVQDGTTKDLSNYTPTLRLRNTNTGDVLVNEEVTVANEKNGIVEYEWQSDDTSDAGIYEGEVEIVDGSETLTFPNDGFFPLTIREGIE